MSVLALNGARRPNLAALFSELKESALDRLALFRATQGAKALELEKPGALGQIDLTTLDIRKGQDCALGQNYGYFDAAPHYLRSRARHYGFNSSILIDYDRLNRAWRKVIPAYRAAAT